MAYILIDDACTCGITGVGTDSKRRHNGIEINPGGRFEINHPRDHNHSGFSRAWTTALVDYANCGRIQSKPSTGEVGTAVAVLFWLDDACIRLVLSIHVGSI